MNTVLSRALAFDDVLVKPKYSTVLSRNDVSLSTNFLGFKFKLPIISANMSTITGYEMAKHMCIHEGLPIIHRMGEISEQVDIVNSIIDNCGDWDVWDPDSEFPVIGASVEVNDAGILRAQKLINAGVKIICLDIAHAHSLNAIGFVRKFITECPSKFPLIVGNIATKEAVQDFMSIDGWHNKIAFKVGIGSGSRCSTRIVTGCGLPTLASLMDIRHLSSTVPLIADGGIKNSGDIVKSLVAGANMVMLGNLLAGTRETPGNVIKYKGEKYKIYKGSASYSQKNEIGLNTQYIEGEETLVPYKGYMDNVLRDLEDGIKSGCSYVGVKDIKELYERGELVEITNSGYKESLPQ